MVFVTGKQVGPEPNSNSTNYSHLDSQTQVEMIHKTLSLVVANFGGVSLTNKTAVTLTPERCSSR